MLDYVVSFVERETLFLRQLNRTQIKSILTASSSRDELGVFILGLTWIHHTDIDRGGMAVIPAHGRLDHEGHEPGQHTKTVKIYVITTG